MLEVIYLKVFAWSDWTLFGGIVAGLLCGFVFKQVEGRESETRHVE